MRPGTSTLKSIIRGLSSMLVAIVLIPLAACQSMQDGARQVGIGAKDLGNKMAAPFKKSGPSPSFGDRSPAAAGDQDPFLPPPGKAEEEKSSSSSMMMAPRPLNVVTLGNPTSLPNSNVRLASKPATR